MASRSFEFDVFWDGLGEAGIIGQLASDEKSFTDAYTTDHELMAQWSIDLVTAAVIAPGPTFPSGTGPRGSAGTDLHNTTTWPSCSYLLRLRTRRSLTDGLLDDPDKWEGSFLTFGIKR